MGIMQTMADKAFDDKIKMKKGKGV